MRLFQTYAKHLPLFATLVTILTFFVAPSRLAAQTVVSPTATGDSRTVTEPSFPTGCTPMYAGKYSKANTTYYPYEPMPSDQAQADFDAIGTTLAGLTAPACLELEASGTNNAFISAPFTIPAGITLVIDAGVTLYASNNPCDYVGSVGNCVGTTVTPAPAHPYCGEMYSTDGACSKRFITIASNASAPTSTSTIMGYGTINGQGKNPLVDKYGTVLPNSGSYGVVTTSTFPGCTTSFYSWYCLTYQAFASSKLHSSPILIYGQQANGFILYKITLQDAPFYNVQWKGNETAGGQTSGFTAWGVKILAPFTAVNTDGIDPVAYIENVTIANSFISNGDDNIAIDAFDAGYQVSNITIQNTYTYSGMGLSIGTNLIGGVNNVLMNNIVQDGLNENRTDITGFKWQNSGVRIKSSLGTGGLVQDVEYNNICQVNELFPFTFSPYFGGGSGDFPDYNPILMQNITVLGNENSLYGSSVDGSVQTSTPNYFNFQGYDDAAGDKYLLHLQMSNINASAANVAVIEPTTSPVTYPNPYPQDTWIYLGPGPVTTNSSAPYALTDLAAADPGTPPFTGGSWLADEKANYVNNTYTSPVCALSSSVSDRMTSLTQIGTFIPLVGELFMNTTSSYDVPATTTNVTSANGPTGNNSFDLIATVQPASEEYPALASTGSIQFWETMVISGSTHYYPQGSPVALVNGMAKKSFSNLTGTSGEVRTFWAQYVDDSGYNTSHISYVWPYAPVATAGNSYTPTASSPNLVTQLVNFTIQ